MTGNRAPSACGRDLDDIRELLRANRGSLDMQQVRRYFAIFDRQSVLDDILTDLTDLTDLTE